MFGIDGSILAFVLLAGSSAGAIAYAFLFKTIADEKNVGKRLETVKRSDADKAQVKASRDRVAEVAKRRKTVQDTLKELDDKQKSKDRNIRKPPLRMQLRQAGTQMSVERFYLYSVVSGLVVTLLAFVGGRAAHSPAWRVACRRRRPAALGYRLQAVAPREGVPAGIPQRAGRHRSCGEIGPSAE